MNLWRKLVVLLQFLILQQLQLETSQEGDDSRYSIQWHVDNLRQEHPSVMVVLLIRNKAHVLPTFLTYFENLDYPKQRMSLWIRSDHNIDDSNKVIDHWLSDIGSQYHSVNFTKEELAENSSDNGHVNESSIFDWPASRFRHVIALKEEALRQAQHIWADYIFFLDADVIITLNLTLKHLIELQMPIVAPMLRSESLYSNYWCGMSDDYYYKRTDEYHEIYNSQKIGVFSVPMIHSAILINLNYESTRHYLTFDKERLIKLQQDLKIESYNENEAEKCLPYKGPMDDVIVFAISANCSRIPLLISNDMSYGYILQPLEPHEYISNDIEQLLNVKLNIINDMGEMLPTKNYFQKYEHAVDKHRIGLSHIYMINLERRPERRLKMEALFNILGLQVETFSAVDGITLNHQVLKEMNIKFLNGYEDPYHHRQMTMGEIGCFLSHYNIWERIVERNQQLVLILEDDIRFEPYFIDAAKKVLKEASSLVPDYDLIYFGRKRLKEEPEPYVDGASNLVHVGYSYWTLGYVISFKGAQKLLQSLPLEKLLPVDEFLPIMFDRHPNRTWSAMYEGYRNLKAYSAAPLLLYPTHYTGEAGYISDTEDSALVKPIGVENEKELRTESGAQLKSDRELNFESIQKLQSAATHSKYHDEI